MNVDNGQMYYCYEDWVAAKERGENIVEFDAPSMQEAQRKAEQHKRIIDMFGPPVKHETILDSILEKGLRELSI